VVSKRRVLSKAWLAFALLSAATASAQAHLMNLGFGSFYDGLAHPLLSPEDLLPVAAVTLLAGLGGARHGRSVLWTLPAAWLTGMAAGWSLAPASAPAWLGAVITAITGALVATDQRWPLIFVVGLAAAVGLLLGYGNGHDVAGSTHGLLAIAGIACSLFATTSLLAGQAASVRAQWARLAIRISGSWIAAVGLLMLGWSMRA
jgi:urease accessory protein